MTETALKPVTLDKDMVAKTILPVAFQGREVAFEARAYRSAADGFEALALINRAKPGEPHGAGTAKAGHAPLVRVHSGCVTGDIFQSLRCDCHAQLHSALDQIAVSDGAILIYLPYHEGRGIGLFQKIKAYALQDQGLDTVDANLKLGHPADARDYQLAAEILKDLGVLSIRLMTNNPAKCEALKKDGIDVVEKVALVVPAGPHAERYLETKRNRMSHKL